MAAGSPCGSADIEELRGNVRKILESPGFAGAKQLQAFLTYASEAVFQGRSVMEQAEIAREVLGRGDEFNPLDDPSVRKIASLLRQRLQRYYETEGTQDRIIITLPLRSYLPRFQFREEPDLGESSPEETIEVPVHAPSPPTAMPVPGRTWPRWLSVLALAIGASGGYSLHFFAPTAHPPAGEFHIWTARGDMANRDFDLPKNAILLGPEVNDHDEVVVRMRFRPTQPTHHAGLSIFGDADNYVEVGRVFRGRAFLQFAAELEGRYLKGEAQLHYDPDGQTLTPIWLALRRSGNEYRAFIGLDGAHWTSLGEPVALSKPLAHPRVALYAFHGHTSATSAEAIFDHLSVGPGLHDWPADTPVDSVFGAWQVDKTCHAVNSLVTEGLGVRFTGLASGRPCTGEIVKRVPPGDWSISTKVDFVPANGFLTGIQVRGTKGRFRVVRWNINGNTISAEVVHSEQVNVPDFAGSPPITLRIACNRGVMQASFSRDDVEYAKLPLKVELSSLGQSPVVGYQFGKIGWLTGTDQPPLVYWIHQEVTQVHPLE